MRTTSATRLWLTGATLTLALLAQGCAGAIEARQAANDALTPADPTSTENAPDETVAPEDSAAATAEDLAARTARDAAAGAAEDPGGTAAADDGAAASAGEQATGADAGAATADGGAAAAAPDAAQTVGRRSAAGGPSPGAQFQEWNVPDRQRDRVLGLLAAAGIEWLRVDVGWRSFEQDCDDCYSRWYIDRIDGVIADARRHGMDVMLTVHETPKWANGGDKLAPPADASKFAEFMRWLARTYRGRVIGYEIWNEPNVDGYFHGTPAEYVTLLRAAYRGVKAGDPDGTVVFGGPSFQDAEFIAKAYDAGAGGHFDVMATHPYQGASDAPPEHESDGERWWITEQPTITEVMRANGDGGKQVWWTEFAWSTVRHRAGAPSWRRGVTEAQQGEYLVRALKLAGDRYPEVTRASWYTAVEIADADAFTRGYALIRRDMTAKPALDALRRHTAGG